MRRRALAALSLPLVLALALAGLGTWWLRTGRLPAAGATWMTVTRTGGSDATPAPGAPVYVLVVGSDARLGETVARGDAIHVIGVDPASGRATMLDIPRDTGAAIPGHGTDKINAAMSLGGPELLAQTVGNLVGVRIPYVVTTDFDGFMEYGGPSLAVSAGRSVTVPPGFYQPVFSVRELETKVTVPVPKLVLLETARVPALRKVPPE